MGNRLILALTAAAVLLRAQSPLIWFCPLDPLVRPEVGYGGSGQYLQLFVPDAPWARAAAQVSVFKIYPQWATQASDADLVTQFADLRRRGIALALEWGMLTPTAKCGAGVEGFGAPGTLEVLRRIARLGGDLRYIAMDEPIYFGTLYKGANGCRMTVEEMARNAAVTMSAIQQEFPQVAIGDIEPFPVDDTDPNWLDQYSRGMDALQAATGTPLAFFHSDIGWSSTHWLEGVAAVRQAAADRGIPFGIIYNSDGSQQGDEGWLRAAEGHMVDAESNGGSPPDHVIFQSWNAYPKTLLPEDSSSAFTNLIDRYFRARTQLTVGTTLDGSSLAGSLASAGAGLAGAAIQFSASPLNGGGVESNYVFEGTTPAGTQNLVFGLRVNEECGGCNGVSDFYLRGFVIEAGGQVIARDFSSGLKGWGISDGSLVSIEDGQLHAHAEAGQQLLVNSPPIAFAADGQDFKLTVIATVSPKSAGSGYFTAVFLNAVRELNRSYVNIAAPDVELGAGTTDDSGQFQFAIPALAFGLYRLNAGFSGDVAYWPAKADLTVPAAGLQNGTGVRRP